MFPFSDVHSSCESPDAIQRPNNRVQSRLRASLCMQRANALSPYLGRGLGDPNDGFRTYYFSPNYRNVRGCAIVHMTVALVEWET